MSSLREVKDRIASVRSTLKITSAMKLVASSKLRKVQRTVESLRPYEEELGGILSSVLSAGASIAAPPVQEDRKARTVLLAFAGNSSMCGAFNANAVRKVHEFLANAGDDVEIWAFGRKMADALRKSGRPCAKDCSGIVAQPSFGAVAELARELQERYLSGEIAEVHLVYNHFVSTGHQKVVSERWLPFEPERSRAGQAHDTDLYILEPGAGQLAESLLPQVLNLRLYAALLDSAASENAARMIAMQAATDNGEELLAELSLEYNKGRQYKITSEILDLAGAAQN